MPDSDQPSVADPAALGTTDVDPDRRAIVRSEERLVVTTVRVPTRRVRLEKYVVTETRTITVEVSHERARLVETDAADDTAAVIGLVDGQLVDQTVDDRPFDADDRTGNARWLTLHEEHIEVVTRVVPVERVRLEVTSVVESRTVTENVRREDVRFEPVDPPLHTAPTTKRDSQ